MARPYFRTATIGKRRFHLLLEELEARTVPAASARIVIEPPENNIFSSTYSPNSFQVLNNSTAGINIQRVVFDLTGALLPDMVFAPTSAAGDTTAKPFTPDNASPVGLNGHTYLNANTGGFNGLQVDFLDFNAGEFFNFSIDVDPLSINGVASPGPEQSGSVSGVELMGSLITVTFSDGTTQSNRFYRKPSAIGGSLTVTAAGAPAQPSIQFVGLTSPVTVTAAGQTVRIQGPAGAGAALFIAEAGMFTDGVAPNPFQTKPYAANTGLKYTELTATIGAGGFVDVPVTLTKTGNNGGLNYFVAAIKAADGRTGLTSNVAIAKYNPGSNTPPTVATAASATLNAAGTQAQLGVLGADNGGEANLTYTWSVVSKPAGAADPTFSANGTNAAKSAIATFSSASSSTAYVLKATISDQGGLTTSSNVSVTVAPKVTTIAVSPTSASLTNGATQAFAASAKDQFGVTLASQPAFTWSVDSGGQGAINASGTYTAPATGTGSATVRATSGSVSGTATVNFAPASNTPPTVATAASATLNAAGTQAQLGVLGADNGGEANLTYTWSVVSKPAGAADPTFSANGTNAAKNAIATFSTASSTAYVLKATITDQGGLNTSSNVTVTVAPKLTTIVVSPTAVSLASGATQSFAASAKDQFGATLGSQPAFTWSVDSGGQGTVNASGTYTAPATGAGSATVRATSGAVSGAATVNFAPVATTRSINAGGGAVGAFSADTGFAGGSIYGNSNVINTTGVTNAAPAAVYQTERYGNFSYSVAGLTAGASHTVRLHFAEIYWTAVDKRVFNVNINGAPALTNFDIFAQAGAPNKALVREFTVAADGTGKIVVQLVSIKDNAKISGLEVVPAATALAINAGGGASGSFVADTGFTGGSTYGNGNAINTTGVANAAPASVYQTERFGNFSYTAANLTPGASYTVRLHFAEIYWTTAGKRVFNVNINGAAALTNFDIFTQAGAANKAVVRQFTATADSTGKIVIQFASVIDNAKLSGLEIIPN